MLNINIMPGAASAASALQAEKVRMEVISQNIANASTTSTPEGGPYMRQVVRFETIMANQFDPNSAVQEVRVAAEQPGEVERRQRVPLRRRPRPKVRAGNPVLWGSGPTLSSRPLPNDLSRPEMIVGLTAPSCWKA